MNEQHPVFSRDYDIRSTTINARKELDLFGLLGLLQDTAAEHAFKLNFGFEQMEEMGAFWVLIRQYLKISSWPTWHDTITIQSWTLPPRGIYAIREFEIFNKGLKIGSCSTTWMVLNSKSRRPQELNDMEQVFIPRRDYRLDYSASKISPSFELERQGAIAVRNSDLDLNTHVNNTKYAQWILDLLPYEVLQRFTIREYAINFLEETHLGDNISCYYGMGTDRANPLFKELYFSGIKNPGKIPVFNAMMKIAGSMK